MNVIDNENAEESVDSSASDDSKDICKKDENVQCVEDNDVDVTHNEDDDCDIDNTQENSNEDVKEKKGKLTKKLKKLSKELEQSESNLEKAQTKLDDAQKRLEVTEKEFERYKEVILERVQKQVDEFEQFKKRAQDEKANDKKYRAQSLISEIIPILDNFERAISINSPSQDVKNFLIGMKMVYNQLLSSLLNEGVVQTDPSGEMFDPKLHEAVELEENTGEESGKIINVISKGYVLNGRIIRPAIVKVAK